MARRQIRHAPLGSTVVCGTISLDKVPGDSNLADLLTKPITGSRFYALRARVLGLPA